MYWIKLSCSHLLRKTSESRVTHGIGKGGEKRAGAFSQGTEGGCISDVPF